MSDQERYKDDSVAEEVSATGERLKGATKDAVGAVTGNRSLEREGERENAEGRARQGNNNVLDETDGVRGATVGGRRNLVTGMYDTPAAAGKAYDDLTNR
ncbi:MAG: CsbD family protein, partial [Vicinamibacterales bacterium]